jgi:tRNA threonylcarbamoyl adenosine modification protein YeaZ
VNTVLAIDTASADFALALACDRAVVRSVAVPVGQDHSRLLLKTIDDLIGGDRAALAGIVVVRGPGSYAGIRVGIATAQGLALALGIPVRGVSTLEAVAHASDMDTLTAIHPAGRGEFATQPFRAGVAEGGITAVRADDLAGQPLAGEGAGPLGGHEVGPEARCRAALDLGLALLAAGDPGHDVDALYLREPNISLPRKARVATPTQS